MRTLESAGRSRFYWVGIFLLVLWLIFLVDVFVPYEFTRWGLQPRKLHGVPGILLMPLLHDNWGHLFGNTISLSILLGLLVSSRPGPWLHVILIVLFGDLLLWLIGRSHIHVGASGLAFGLIGLLVVVGFLDRRLVTIGVALLVGILFGGTVLGGVIPQFDGNVSWDGHLCGLVSGGVLAFVTHRKPSWFSESDF